MMRRLENIYDVFNKKGKYLGRMMLDNYGKLMGRMDSPFMVKIKGGLLYYLREKEDGYKELVVC